MKEITYLDVVTLSIALIGACLGIVNLLRDMSRDRLRLRVVPNHSIPVPVKGGPPLVGRDAEPRILIEVTNLSTFPVTIKQIGFILSGPKPMGFIVGPRTMDGGPFPRRLEPRESFSVLCEPEEHKKSQFAQVRCAFITTACGTTVKGHSKALKSYVRQARKQAA